VFVLTVAYWIQQWLAWNLVDLLSFLVILFQWTLALPLSQNVLGPDVADFFDGFMIRHWNNITKKDSRSTRFQASHVVSISYRKYNTDNKVESSQEDYHIKAMFPMGGI